MNEAAPQKRDFGTSQFTTGDGKVNPVTSLCPLEVARELDSWAASLSYESSSFATLYAGA